MGWAQGALTVFSTVLAFLCAHHYNHRSGNRSGPSEFSVVYVTVPTTKVASAVSGALLRATPPLAACVNSIPNVRSMYTWEGKIESEEEILLMIKTRTAMVADITSLLTDSDIFHPYELPEVIAVPIQAGSPKYLDWIRKNTK